MIQNLMSQTFDADNTISGKIIINPSSLKAYFHLAPGRPVKTLFSNNWSRIAWLRCEFCERREGPPLSWLRLFVITPPILADDQTTSLL